MSTKRKRSFWAALSPIGLVTIILIFVGAPLIVSGQLPPGSGCQTQTPVESRIETSLEPDSAGRLPDDTLLHLIGPSAPAPSVIEVTAESFAVPLTQDEVSRLYAKSSVLLRRGETLRFDVSVPAAGDYTFTFDVAASSASGSPEGQLRVDGQFPIPGLQRFIFPVYFRGVADAFPKDRYGNDALIPQVREIRWTSAAARDVNFSQPYPLRVPLSAGDHRLQLTLASGELYVGSVYVAPASTYPGFTDYLAAHDSQDASGVLLTLEAELPSYKNDSSVRPASDRNLTVTPYDTYCLLLNTLGGEGWGKSGSAVYYQFEVPQDGLYAITFRALQSTRTNFTVFRRITVNGSVPFEELNAVPFPYSAAWEDIPLGGETPYRIFLLQGLNTLGIEATNAPYLPAIDTIQSALIDINTLALEIRRLTGNQRDPFREWVISDYIPDIRQRLDAIIQNLIDDKDTLLAIDQSGASPEVLTYQMAIDNLLFLAADPDQIPIYMSRFSEGTGSAAQQLGSLLPLLQLQPLALDKIYIHSSESAPVTPAAPLTTSLVEDFKRFLYSFRPDPYQSLDAADDELEIWVNRPRQYVNLLQLMADASFTPQTGIRVKFSIMPNESKLVLANAAGIQPDVALGVSTNIPYELAIRSALYDLRSFEDFDSFIPIFAPGSLLSYIIDDSVYALPETQDFWVTFYRQDILDSLGLPVPDTWDEVVEILPELQRFGMNYNAPLSSGSGQKGYLLTAPYLFNYGAQLYSDEGYATGLRSEEAVAAIRFMADSFTLYGMPLTTVSFYQDFRYGTLPVGISNTETYIKLVTTAPEIGGRWGISLYPATVLPDGTRSRYATGSAQTSIIFSNTDKAPQAWQFLKWWLSTPTQSDFQEQLVLNYGREYLWFSANLDAFSRLDIPEEHKSMILQQWQWLQEPVRLPGSYMQERELSNIWNRIVFDGVNPRVAIDRSVVIINREINRKMEEFGYLDEGRRVREFKIPTIESVTAWMHDAN
ncbi:MAG: extracellular solute-binding protein [Chloroflexi bacterium]|nr:extracellular solute-binding protein [Chloroflexota bacterium]